MLSPPSRSSNTDLIIATHSLLSSSLPPHRNTIHHHHRRNRSLAMCRPYPSSSSTANDGRSSRRLLSASIPLPQSHIHRTPSELQLADDILRAEYEDVRMCVRLVTGMRSQCLAAGYVHPRTLQSVQDILKTKHAHDDDDHKNQLEILERRIPLSDHAEEEDDGDADWSLAYEEEGGPFHHPLGAMSPLSTFVIKSLSIRSSGSSYQSQRKNGSNRREDSSEDDECVFSLEL